MKATEITSSRRGVLGAFGIGSAALALAACGGSSDSAGGGKPTVTTSAYPMDYLAQKVGGDKVTIHSLAKPSVDPHGLELSVREAAQLEKSDLVLQVPGYQSALDDAISAHPPKNVLDISKVVKLLPNTGEDEHDHEDEHGASDAGGDHADEHGHDDHAHDDHADEHGHASDAGGDHTDEHDHADEHGHEGHSHGAYDPHFWHSPLYMADVADALAEELGKISSDDKKTFTDNAKKLRTELEQLDAELKKAYDAVPGEKPFVTSHTAFAYLAEHYGLHQIGIAGVDPETEPSPKRLAELATIIKEEKVSTVFFETTASPKVAKALAEKVGVEAEELDNLETQLNKDADYPAVMRENSKKLVESWK